jgi:hypothetical protein
MKALNLAFALALGTTGAVHAQDTYNIGNQAAPWLTLPTSARVAAMGGAAVALGGDIDTLTVNPASLAELGGQQVSLMHDVYVQDTSLEHAAYGLGLGEAGGAAVAVDYMNYGNIQGYNADGTPANNLNPWGMAVSAGYGYDFGPVEAGATLKVVSEALTSDSNSAFGCDLGVKWSQAKDSGLSAGAALRNWGSQLDQSNLPTTVQAGLGYRLPLLEGTEALALALDYSAPTADVDGQSLALGGEFSGNKLWAVRAGYQFVGNDGVSGLSLGAGLKYQIFALDYAFVTEGALGDSNEFSLSVKF